MKTKSMGGQSIFVEWEHVALEDMNGVPLGYKVKFNSSDGKSSGTVSVNYKNRMNTLTGLRPMTTYIIDVCAFTEAGTGPCLRSSNTTGTSGKIFLE